MFINYFRDTRRESLLNLLVARIVLGLYGMWKLSTLEWRNLHHLEIGVIKIYSRLTLPEPIIEISLYLMPLVAFLSLFLFCIGYRVRFTALLSGLSIGFLSLIISFPGTYYSLSTLTHLLFIYSMFSEDDKYSWTNLSQIPQKFSSSKKEEKSHQIRFLKWMLVYLSLTYFVTAFNRVVSGGALEWLNTTALPRTIRYTLELQGKNMNLLADLIVSEPVLSIVGISATMLIEAGFLVAVLSRKSIDGIITGVIGLHLMFAAVLNLYTLNQLLLISLLLPWDKLYNQLTEVKGKLVYGLAANQSH